MGKKGEANTTQSNGFHFVSFRFIIYLQTDFNSIIVATENLEGGMGGEKDRERILWIKYLHCD